MVKCHKCGHNNEEGHEFCEECGSKLKVEFKCKKCGHRLKPDEDFCEECGMRLKEPKVIHHERRGESTLVKYKWLFLTFGIIFVIGLVFVFAVPLPYEAKESYSERVPYTTTESSSEMVDLKYNTKPVFYDTYDCGENDKCGKVLFPVTNTDKIGGNIEVEIIAYGYQDQALKVCKFNEWIEAGQTIDFNCALWDTNKQEKIYGYKYGSAHVTKVPKINRQVDKDIVRYKDEQKERVVTRYATLFQRWTGRAKL